MGYINNSSGITIENEELIILPISYTNLISFIIDGKGQLNKISINDDNSITLNNFKYSLSLSNNVSTYNPIGSTFGSVKELVYKGDNKLSITSRLISERNNSSNNILGTILGGLGVNLPITLNKGDNNIYVSQNIKKIGDLLSNNEIILLKCDILNNTFFFNYTIFLEDSKYFVTVWNVSSLTISPVSSNSQDLSIELEQINLSKFDSKLVLDTINS